MPKLLVRITDIYLNASMNGAAAPIVAPGSSTLFVGGLPALQMTDSINPFPDMPLPNTNTVFHNGTPLVGMNDQTAQGGSFLLGLPTVTID
ncbi:MAG TPA: hypothetical protein ENJ82_04800 [Bacteroidetes bacterium]|nr:hypothetical protein [Bacteroidota bacterium]